mmetsp:Transcript_18813/g.43552  ORF Transcript_18813/g.43552 Transcript_18813/m.43552 type:complete len:232 (-) Transcript_18813:1082-1777(-)
MILTSIEIRNTFRRNQPCGRETARADSRVRSGISLDRPERVFGFADGRRFADEAPRSVFQRVLVLLRVLRLPPIFLVVADDVLPEPLVAAPDGLRPPALAFRRRRQLAELILLREADLDRPSAQVAQVHVEHALCGVVRVVELDEGEPSRLPDLVVHRDVDGLDGPEGDHGRPEDLRRDVLTQSSDVDDPLGGHEYPSGRGRVDVVFGGVVNDDRRRRLGGGRHSRVPKFR